MTNHSLRIAVGILSILLLIIAIIGATTYARSVVKKNDFIGEQTAEEFAMLDAGVQPEEASNIHTRLDREKGQYVYDVRFTSASAEYGYQIRAVDGTILSKNADDTALNQAQESQQSTDQFDQQNVLDNNADNEQGANVPATNTQTDQNAQTQTNQNTQKDKATEKDNTDDTTEKPTEQTPATANTGREAAASESNESPNRQNTYISVDQAKKIALDHAGLTENEVRFSGAKLENDEGIVEYEIEFYKAGTEYEYDIDAVTGVIIDYELD